LSICSEEAIDNQSLGERIELTGDDVRGGLNRTASKKYLSIRLREDQDGERNRKAHRLPEKG